MDPLDSAGSTFDTSSIGDTSSAEPSGSDGGSFQQVLDDAGLNPDGGVPDGATGDTTPMGATNSVASATEPTCRPPTFGHAERGRRFQRCVFDTIADLGLFTATPKLRAWRAALAERPSVRHAVGPNYPDLVRTFLVRHQAYLLQLSNASTVQESKEPSRMAGQ